MEKMTLSNAANQEFTVDRDGSVYALTFRTFAGLTLATVAKDGATLASSIPCVRNGWLIPYKHLVGEGGNFRFESSSYDYPTYDGFNTKYVLCYYSPEEYAEIE